jgi:hypothetical protein
VPENIECAIARAGHHHHVIHAHPGSIGRKHVNREGRIQLLNGEMAGGTPGKSERTLWTSATLDLLDIKMDTVNFKHAPIVVSNNQRVIALENESRGHARPHGEGHSNTTANAIAVKIQTLRSLRIAKSLNPEESSNNSRTFQIFQPTQFPSSSRKTGSRGSVRGKTDTIVREHLTTQESQFIVSTALKTSHHP